MKLLIQRVTEASVTVEGQLVSRIGKGILVLLGIHIDDDQAVAKKLAQKLPKIKLWENNEKKPWAAGAQDHGFEILVVSQFTLYNTMKGNKPDFHLAKKADEAKQLYDFFLAQVGAAYSKDKVQGGVFQAMMQVQLVNDGPVTIEIEELPKKQQTQIQQQQQQLQQMESPQQEQE